MSDVVAGMESPFEDDYQIEEVAEETGPSKDDILKELTELRKSNEELKLKADQTAGLSQSFGQLGERLEKVVSRPAPQPQMAPAPGETQEQFKERINRKYLEDPYETMLEFSNRTVGAAFQTMAEQSLQLQRKIAYLESGDKDFISKYRDEIDAEVARVPIDQQLRDPDVVRRSIDVVRARHIDDLVEQKINERLAKMAPAAAAAPKPVGSSEVPSTPGAPPASSPRRVQITPAKRDRIYARMRGELIPDEKFNDYVGWLVEDGEFDSV